MIASRWSPHTVSRTTFNLTKVFSEEAIGISNLEAYEAEEGLHVSRLDSRL